jgi:hypothetical protein
VLFGYTVVHNIIAAAVTSSPTTFSEEDIERIEEQFQSNYRKKVDWREI